LATTYTFKHNKLRIFSEIRSKIIDTNSSIAFNLDPPQSIELPTSFVESPNQKEQKKEENEALRPSSTKRDGEVQQELVEKKKSTKAKNEEKEMSNEVKSTESARVEGE
jgi:hypothetical protein